MFQGKVDDRILVLPYRRPPPGARSQRQRQGERRNGRGVTCHPRLGLRRDSCGADNGEKQSDGWQIVAVLVVQLERQNR